MAFPRTTTTSIRHEMKSLSRKWVLSLLHALRVQKKKRKEKRARATTSD